MFKNVFSKYYLLMSFIIVASLLAMGGLLLISVNNYWQSEKQQLLQNNAESVASYVQENNISYRVDSEGVIHYQVAAEGLYGLLSVISPAIEAEVQVTDTDGVVLLCSDGEGCPHVGQAINSGAAQSLSGEAVSGTRLLYGLYGSLRYTAGVPVHINNHLVAYVFVSSPAGGLEVMAKLFQVFLVSALGVLALTFLLLYIITYRLVRPLKQMAAATRSFSEGDFSARVPVKGNDEVSELASTLNNMAVSLSSVETMSRSFVANVSHELKTPMTTIAGFVDGILDGTVPPERRDHYLKIVSGEVKRMSRLVRSMLELSRLDSENIRLNPVRFSLTDMTCETLLAFEQRMKDKQLTVTGLEGLPTIELFADRDYIGQVVYNLIDNAVKFTDPGTAIDIRIERGIPSGEPSERVFFTIRNAGAGIAPEELPHIFERFYKTDKSRGQDTMGVGLGLYLVKSIISLHHGEIRVRSVEGQFTEFSFWLPVAP